MIAGIVFLGYELRQNNEYLEAQARHNHKEARANWLEEFESNPEIARIVVKVNNGETLSSQEQLQWSVRYERLFVNWEWEFFESQMGRFERLATREFYENILFNRSYWNNYPKLFCVDKSGPIKVPI